MSKNLTLIEGITAPITETLKKVGIKTIEQLANSSPQKLEKELTYSFEIIEEWISNAIKYLEGEKTPKIPPGIELTSKYSMKTTTKRDMEENEEL
ncbi:MAG: hypothetical protein BAJALOKI1v1_360007 [Promethearchaeota archaeon]|nr:MAG: hypothetical protein BAJALOKI1v1_360007 [Candidatus Lokiarchaeota archaeon]